MFNAFRLKKGVRVHSFIDGSGCVFFKDMTSEIIVLAINIEQLEQTLTSIDPPAELLTLVENGYLELMENSQSVNES